MRARKEMICNDWSFHLVGATRSESRERHDEGTSYK